MCLCRATASKMVASRVEADNERLRFLVVIHCRRCCSDIVFGKAVILNWRRLRRVREIRIVMMTSMATAAFLDPVPTVMPADDQRRLR